MNDGRDEGLGAVLDRTALAIESEPVDRLPDVLRRGTRRRAARFTAIGVAVAVFAGAAGWAGLTYPTEEAVEPIPADIADWETFASLEDNGWTMQVPPSWRIQELPACPNAPERIGVVVTNTDFEFLSPRGTAPECEDRFVFAGFPRDGVALAFHPSGDFFGSILRPSADTALPLVPALLIRSGGIVGGPAHSFQSVDVDRETLGVIRRFVGPDATESDVAALDRMLASFDARGAARWIEGDVSPANELEDIRIQITRPSTWRLKTFPRFSVIDAPNPIAVLTSPGIRALASTGIREGSCRPFLSAPSFVEVDRLRAPSTLILISDATDSWTVPDLGPRPDHFRFQDALEAGEGRCGRSVHTLRFGFEAAGRQIFVDVASSSNWSTFTDQPEMLRYILDSIRISKA